MTEAGLCARHVIVKSMSKSTTIEMLAYMTRHVTVLGKHECGLRRYVVNWLLSGYVFLASPSSLRGTAHAFADEMWDARTTSLGCLR